MAIRTRWSRQCLRGTKNTIVVFKALTENKKSLEWRSNSNDNFKILKFKLTFSYLSISLSIWQSCSWEVWSVKIQKRCHKFGYFLTLIWTYNLNTLFWTYNLNNMPWHHKKVNSNLIPSHYVKAYIDRVRLKNQLAKYFG